MTRKRAPGRWVFGEYIVFARNEKLARRVHDAAASRPDMVTLFGAVALSDGEGYWVQIVPRKPRPLSAARVRGPD